MLTDEQRAKVAEAAQAFTVEPPSETLSVDATLGTDNGAKVEDVKTVEVEVPSIPSVKVEPVEADSNDNGATAKGHNVPYSRFKNVVEARNGFKAQVGEYETQISSLQQKLDNLEQSSNLPPAQQSQPETETSSWLDNFLAEDSTETTPAMSDRYTQLDQRLYKFEVAKEEDTLRRELSNVGGKFPKVPHKLLLQAVIKDPSVDMMKLAEEYSTFMGSIEEQGIARYLKEQGIAPTPEDTREPVPRPRSASSTPSGTVTQPKVRPKSIAGASNALRDILKKDNFLKN